MVEQDAGIASQAGWARVMRMEGINNFRDYGDMTSSLGGRVRKGRLFRSAHLARASDGDLARLADLGVTGVTDLRHPGERAQQPSAWAGKLALAAIEEPAPEDELADGSVREAPHVAAFRASNYNAAAMKDFLGGHYAVIPYQPRHIALFRRYFEALAKGDGAMLIHCAAGKDRTGILARLTHHLLGVHDDDAMEDYLLSNDAANIAERLPSVRRSLQATYGNAVGEESLMVLLQVVPEYMAIFHRALAEQSGSIDGYLADVLGIDGPRREAIRARLIA